VGKGITMKSIVAFLRGEPVLVGAVVVAITAEGVALGIGQGEMGIIAAGLALVSGFISRGQVIPTQNAVKFSTADIPPKAP